MMTQPRGPAFIKGIRAAVKKQTMELTEVPRSKKKRATKKKVAPKKTQRPEVHKSKGGESIDLDKAMKRIEDLPRMDRPAALSRLVAETFKSKNVNIECRQQALQWTIDHMVSIELDATLREFNALYSFLEKEGPGDCAGDTVVEIVKWPKHRAISIEDQNLNFVFTKMLLDDITDDDPRSLLCRFIAPLRVYRYWKKMPKEEEKEWTRAKLLKDPSWILKRYTDCPRGAYGHGPSRPTLGWLVKNDGSDGFGVLVARESISEEHAQRVYCDTSVVFHALWRFRCVWEELLDQPSDEDRRDNRRRE